MKKETLLLADNAEKLCKERFGELDRLSLYNTERVLNAFRANRVSDACFARSWP